MMFVLVNVTTTTNNNNTQLILYQIVLMVSIIRSMSI